MQIISINNLFLNIKKYIMYKIVDGKISELSNADINVDPQYVFSKLPKSIKEHLELVETLRNQISNLNELHDKEIIIKHNDFTLQLSDIVMLKIYSPKKIFKLEDFQLITF